MRSSHRDVENTPVPFSGKCAVGIVQIAGPGGEIPQVLHYRLLGSRIKSGFVVFFRVTRSFRRSMFWAWRTSQLEKVCAMAIGITLLNCITENQLWVDKEQVESFMDEYKRSSYKQQLVSDKQQQLVAIREVRLNVPLISFHLSDRLLIACTQV